MPGSAPPPPADPVSWDDGKAADALRTIGELAHALGIRQHVLRYWEDQFPMLSPLKRSGGRRYYRPEDVALVRRIDRLVHHEGYTLRGARAVLESEARATGPATMAADTPTTDRGGGAPPGLAQQLRTIRARLAAALNG